MMVCRCFATGAGGLLLIRLLALDLRPVMPGKAGGDEAEEAHADHIPKS